MLTPQQVQEISFERAVFGGYAMDSVDDFLEPLTEDYIALYKENSVLKSKMRILVEKLEEYRKQENSMQSAILAAQRTCEQMTAETEKKCAQLLREAEEAAQKKAENVDELIGEEKDRLDAARAATAQFIDGMENRLTRQLELLEELRKQELPKREPEAPAEPQEQSEERVHQFTPAPFEQPEVIAVKHEAYDFEADNAHPSAEDKADALIVEIGQKLEESFGGQTAPAETDEPTRRMDTLRGMSPQKHKMYEALDSQFGKNYSPTKRD